MSDRSKRDQAGFSLVETIAAMAILALAAIPLLQLVNNSIRGSASLENRYLARTVAENVMVQEITKTAIPTEDELIQAGFSEQLGKRFNWVVTASPVEEALPQLLMVEVRLEQNPQVLSQLTGIRLPVLPSMDNEIASSTSSATEDSQGGSR